MNQKKSTTLYGALMSPLAVGHCALIRYQGQLMRTSPGELASTHAEMIACNCSMLLKLNAGMA